MLPTFGKLYQFSSVSPIALLTRTQALIVVITAIVIIVEIIVLFKIFKDKHKKVEVATINANLKTADARNTIEKIKRLEAEKKTLLVEIEELKKTADTKATALESEVTELQNELKSMKMLMQKKRTRDEAS